MTEPVDLSELFAETDLEIKRLGWTPQQGREFLIETYGKRGRTLLTQEELLDFLRYLKYLPTPDTKLENESPKNLNQPNESSSKKATNRTKNKHQPIYISEVDASELIAQINLEMERIGLSPQVEIEYLIQNYDKQGKTLLTEKELFNFLEYLQSQPTPNLHNITPFNNSIKQKCEPNNLNEIIAKTDVEMERLDWTPQQGREYLIQTYNKRGRTLLTEEELLDFLQHLESIPTPQAEISELDPLAGF